MSTQVERVANVARLFREHGVDPGSVQFQKALRALDAAFAATVILARQEERAAERKRTFDVIGRIPATAAGADAFRKRLIEELYVEAAADEARANNQLER